MHGLDPKVIVAVRNQLELEASGGYLWHNIHQISQFFKGCLSTICIGIKSFFVKKQNSYYEYIDLKYYKNTQYYKLLPEIGKFLECWDSELKTEQKHNYEEMINEINQKRIKKVV